MDTPSNCPPDQYPRVDRETGPDDLPTLDACFLGPAGENAAQLESIVVDAVREHVYWRRNFHPEDPPSIATDASHHSDYRAFDARMRQELNLLAAALKRSVPSHSPRYLGHMVSDLLLPGISSYMLTQLYNPNNVSEDSAPVTVDMEVQVGLQLARMLGYPHDPAQPDCAFGHLTSGGTLANIQALRLALSLKAFPVALRAAAVPGIALPEDDWQAFNLSPRQAADLLDQWMRWLRTLPMVERRCWMRDVERHRIEQMGMQGFFAAHPELKIPHVLAPITAHYSWSKGVKLLGLGAEQLELLPVVGMRLDADAVRRRLMQHADDRQPVLMCVAVLGSTEYGTIDPVDQVVAARDAARARGLDAWVHVDAAWGGYLATLFRNEDGTLRRREEVSSEFSYFPSSEVHAAMAALAATDSATVDPHKLGYLPYGAGAFVCRDHRATALLAERADYVFSDGDDQDYLTRYRRLGQYVVEGSKAGAAAAAVYVTHRTLPLDHRHFGRLPRQTVRSAEAFHDAAQQFAESQSARLKVLVPFVPDSNLVCLALNPVGNRDPSVANALIRGLHDAMRCDSRQPVQGKQFFGSMTSLRPELLGRVETRRILTDLGLDPDGLGPGAPEDRLLILRHTLMNPYLADTRNHFSYIDEYFRFLGRSAEALLASLRASAQP